MSKELAVAKLENKVYNFEQRSDEWYKIRELKVTGSPCEKIMKPRGLGQGGQTYCKQIVKETILKNKEERYVSAAMQQGIDREPIAAEVYAEEHMVEVTEVGFIVFYTENPKEKHLNGFLGISPDRLVGKKGGLEIKCPEPDKHTSNLLEQDCPSEYYDQIQMSLFVTGREWWDLMSYNPDFKEGFKEKYWRILPNPEWQLKFIQRATEAKIIVDDFLKTLKIGR